MSAQLDKLVDEELDAAAAAQRGYRTLVRALAAGAGPELREVRATLAAVGKSADELRADVSKQAYRRRQIETVKKGRAAEQERAEVLQAIEAAGIELQKAQEVCNETVGPLQYKSYELVNSIHEGERAARELIETSTDDDLLSDLATIRRKIIDVSKRIEQQDEAVNKLQSALANERSRPRAGSEDDWRGPNDHGGNAETVGRLKRQLDEAEIMLIKMQQDQAALLSDERACLSQMIED